MWLLLLCQLVFSLLAAGASEEDIPDAQEGQYAWISYVTKLDTSCLWRNCFMRRPRQDELGPFWANRGKRDPGYTKEVLYAEEPHWITLRNSLFDEATTDSSPFYVTRGKKDRRKMSQGVRERRDFEDDKSPFFAARGKKNKDE